MKCLPIITLDGPAEVGKSTLAKRLATILGIPYLDTGAMFRCMALKLGPGAEKLPEDELRSRCGQWTFTLSGMGQQSTLFCNGVAVRGEVRTEAVGMLAARIATVPVVREILRATQRAIGEQYPLVAEGRDMGTVVFPEARFKFFLDAAPEVRAMRRLHDANINFALDIGDLEHPYSQFLPFDLLRMNVAEIQHPRWSQCLEEARLRNIPLLAYRVENEAQVHALSQQRIDYLQGYAVRDIITLEIPRYTV